MLRGLFVLKSSIRACHVGCPLNRCPWPLNRCPLFGLSTNEGFTVQEPSQLFRWANFSNSQVIIHKHLCIFSADTIMAMATSSILHWVIVYNSVFGLRIKFVYSFLLIAY